MTTASDSSRSLLRSPIHERHATLGAKLADFGGWEMPIEYPDGGVLKEHAAVREAVGLFDVSHLGKMQVSGDAAEEFVNAQFTNDLERIGSGRAQYSLLCNDSGGVVDDLIVYLRTAGDVFVVPNAANTGTVVDVLRSSAPAGVDVRNQHRDFAVLAVQGPRSEAVLERLGLPHGHEYMAFVETLFQGSPVIVCRTGYTGERGYELIPEWHAALGLWDALVDAVAAEGGRPAGLGARDTLRTEMGYPLHGQDLSPDISPVQARLGWAVGWNKAAFSGRDALLAERERGPARRLWGLRSNDRGIPRPGMQVKDARGNAVVGMVTSGTFSPTLRVGIGLALVDAELEPGAEVTVDVRGRPSSMSVVRPPFVERSPN
jgi:aminomethyltransferase